MVTNAAAALDGHALLEGRVFPTIHYPNTRAGGGSTALAVDERELPVVTDAAAELDGQALLEACIVRVR